MSETRTVSEPLPEGYRMTELGPLPEEWQVVRLGEIVRAIKGRKPPFLFKKPQPGSLAYLTADYFRNGMARQFVPADQSASLPICRESDIVLIWDGSKAGQVFTGLYGVLASTMVKLEFDNTKVCNDFLYFYMLTKFEILNSQTVGSTIPHINKSLFNNLPVPLPPVEEQRAIAHALRRIQEAKEATERVIAALKELKKSLMRYLFTYGPVPVDQAESVPLRETELGPLPQHWQVVRLGEVAEKPQYGFTASAQNKPIGPKFLRITDIQDGEVNWNAVPYCECPAELIEKYRLQNGDILFARTGSVGKTYLVRECPQPTIFASYLIRVRIIEKAIPEFVHLFTQSASYWQQINSQVHGAVQPNINATQLRDLLLPLPPLSEQQEIARILQTVDRRIQAEEQHKRALETLFKTLLHDLMTARRRLPLEFIARFANSPEASGGAS